MVKMMADILSLKIPETGSQGIILCDCTAEVDDLYLEITRFKRHETSILAGTNVLARGINIVAISLVANMNPPLDNSNQSRGAGEAPTMHTHKIGRGGGPISQSHSAPTGTNSETWRR